MSPVPLTSFDDLNFCANSWGGLNGRLAFAIVAAALCSSFQHGYNIGVVNAPESLIEEWIYDVETNRTEAVIEQSEVTLIWSIAVSIYCVGGMMGACITGYVAENFGRKGGLLLNNIFVVVASVFQGCAKSVNSYEMLVAGRFFIGINSGLNAGLAPLYLTEISPVRLRGAVGTVYQLGITISILLSQILGLESVLGTKEHWPLLLALTIVPTIVQLFVLPFCPEAPKYLLVSKGKELEAQKALMWLRNSSEVHDEMEEMRSEYETMKVVPRVTFKELFTNNVLRIPLIISIVVMIGQQFSGINAVMFFSTKIFKMSNLSDVHAQYATLAMGVVNVAMTVVSLILVEKAGRKTLLLTGFIGMFVVALFLTVCLAYAETSTAISYVCIVLVLLFVIMFAVGPGSIPWFLVTELFNQDARPAATSIAVAVNWTANFIVGLGFLPLQEIMKGYVFVIFVVLLLIFVLFVWKKLPETKNKTVEEISATFRQLSYQ
ncbi:hypothetical protein RUM44_001649 [Polyplax serrata]|uniref:Major facilitator superfamily (MFS) profile domain-containing protein n=1 Tax=Polyplax serrata TaxID=468196 RepID=A0ABR1AKN3_POLSC